MEINEICKVFLRSNITKNENCRERNVLSQFCEFRFLEKFANSSLLLQVSSTTKRLLSTSFFPGQGDGFGRDNIRVTITFKISRER